MCTATESFICTDFSRGIVPADRGSLLVLPETSNAFHGSLDEPASEAPTVRNLRKLDLGCGLTKPAGFLGADRFRLPGVDVVLDMDKPFPFADDSFDLVYASHSLEHVRDLMFTIQEVYRICRDRAQVCIVAPYYQQAGNFANPRHQQAFNEHTPRFWTDFGNTQIAPEEYVHPHAAHWGLAASDNDNPGIDLRCLRMEFFYYPEYRMLPPDEQRAARKKYIDVCDQVVYHLLVIKSPLEDEELERIVATMEFYDPPYVAARRASEAASRLADDEAASRASEQLAIRAAEQEQLQAKERAALLLAKQALLAVEKPSDPIAEPTPCDESRSESEFTESLYAAARLAEGQPAAAWANEPIFEPEAPPVLSSEPLPELVTEPTLAPPPELPPQVSLADFNAIRDIAAATARDLDAYTHRRSIRFLRRLSDRSDMRPALSPAYRQLSDDALLNVPKVQSYILQPSVNLQRLGCLNYRLPLNRAGLCGVTLAPWFAVRPIRGLLGIQIQSADGGILAAATASAAEFEYHAPVRFEFPVVDSCDARPLSMQVFVRDIDVPLQILEWRKYRLHGLRSTLSRAFCAVHFS